MLAKQFRVALSLNGKMKGVVLLSQIAAIVQKVVADTWDGSKAEAINAAVGYFINEEGYMDCTSRASWIQPPSPLAPPSA